MLMNYIKWAEDKLSFIARHQVLTKEEEAIYQAGFDKGFKQGKESVDKVINELKKRLYGN